MNNNAEALRRGCRRRQGADKVTAVPARTARYASPLRPDDGGSLAIRSWGCRWKLSGLVPTRKHGGIAALPQDNVSQHRTPAIEKAINSQEHRDRRPAAADARQEPEPFMVVQCSRWHHPDLSRAVYRVSTLHFQFPAPSNLSVTAPPPQK